METAQERQSKQFAAVNLVFKNGTAYTVEVDPDSVEDWLAAVREGNKMTQYGHGGWLPVAYVDGSEVCAAYIDYPAEYLAELPDEEAEDAEEAED